MSLKPQDIVVLVGGGATAHTAPPIKDKLSPSSDEPGPVWPYPDGATLGYALDPLYKTVPRAALDDKAFYEFMALIDMLRIGRAREVQMAKAEISSQLERLAPGHAHSDNSR